ncbi:MAG: hypothetical protein IJT97_11235 [Bacteroidaceae bacterium]|nr:hypothetical protein [Bacteroidaceae bacterium]
METPKINLSDFSKQFAVNIVKMCSTPSAKKNELFALMLHRGVQVGEQVCLRQMQDALTAAKAARYYLELLNDSGLAAGGQLASLLADAETLIKIMYVIVHPKQK